MFSMLPTPIHTYNQSYHYAPRVSSPLSSSPIRSSPLSPRDINVPQRAGSSPMTSPTPNSSSEHLCKRSPSSAQRESAYSKRATKSNPLLHGRNKGDERETRRKLFLRRVREGSEEKRWQARGGDDEMMRRIWIAEQRRLADLQMREAMGVPEIEEEDEEEVDDRTFDEVMADEVARKEEEELEALLASHDIAITVDREMQISSWGVNDGKRHDTPPYREYAPPPDTPYGSDDEDYDSIFMDVIKEESRLAIQTLSPTNADTDQEMMDMS